MFKKKKKESLMKNLIMINMINMIIITKNLIMITMINITKNHIMITMMNITKKRIEIVMILVVLMLMGRM
jgi:hypothetical protein